MRAINLTLPDVSELFMWQRCQQYLPHLQNGVALIEKWKIVFVLDRKSEAVEAGARAQTILAKLANEDAI